MREAICNSITSSAEITPYNIKNFAHEFQKTLPKSCRCCEKYKKLPQKFRTEKLREKIYSVGSISCKLSNGGLLLIVSIILTIYTRNVNCLTAAGIQGELFF